MGRPKTKLSPERLNYLLSLFSTNLTRREIGNQEQTGFSYSVRPLWVEAFGEDAVRERANKLKRIGGSKNTTYMKGRVGSKHHCFKKEKYHSSGYKIIEYPEWYEGSKIIGNNVFEHLVIYCQENNLTKIPSGYIVHHKNKIRTDNNINNLELLTRSEHSKLHRALEREIKIQGVITNG